MLIVDDDWFDEADRLAGALAFALADDDACAGDDARADDGALVLGVADVLAAGEDTGTDVGAELVQVAFGVGWFVFWAVLLDVGLGLGLGDPVRVGVPLGLALGLPVAPGLLVLAEAEAEAEALALELVVLPLLWLPPDDVAGAVGFPLGLLAALVPVSVADGCVDVDAHELGAVWKVAP